MVGEEPIRQHRAMIDVTAGVLACEGTDMRLESGFNVGIVEPAMGAAERYADKDRFDPMSTAALDEALERRGGVAAGSIAEQLTLDAFESDRCGTGRIDARSDVSARRCGRPFGAGILG